MDRSETDRLIVAFFRGDPKECLTAYKRLYTFYFKVLYNFTVARNVNEMDVEDAVQELLTGVWTNKDRLAGKIDNSEKFLAYLIMGLKGKISNLNRKNAKSIPLENEALEDWELIGSLADESIDPVEIDEFMDIMDGIIRDKLPYYSKSVIYLYRTKHYNFPDIARMLGISEKTAKKHLADAFDIIHKELPKYYNLN
jgi:RNA polymerase sigma factor, sigma-70 family